MKVLALTLSMCCTIACVAQAQNTGNAGFNDPRLEFANPREQLRFNEATRRGVPTNLPGAFVQIQADAAQDSQTGSAPAAMPNPMFIALDADQDGVITRIELRRASSILMRVFDDNQDGMISLAEVTPAAAPAAAQAMNPAVGALQVAAGTIQQYDRNRDGRLSRNEVPAQMAMTLRGADQNGDGAIDAGELAAALAGPGAALAGQGLAAGIAGNAAANLDPRTFMQYDRDGDGMLTAQEVPQQLMPLLQGADVNGDRRIDASELQALSERMGNQPAGGAEEAGGNNLGAP